MEYLEQYVLEDSKAKLTVYLHEVYEEIAIKQRPLVLVLPGGGYGMVSEREAEPLATAFYQMGYHAAILRYSVKEKAANMQPIKEGIAAMRLIREHAPEWHVISDKIAVCGSSAGAHLAGSLGVMWNEPALMKAMEYGDNRYQPNAMILCYPVITSGEFANRGSFFNLTGSNEDDEANKFFSLEKRVNTATPPAFIWHTQTDDCVPVENALLMATALQRSGVPYELHIYRQGGHGLSLCTEQTNVSEPYCADWLKLCEKWLRETFS